MPNLIFSYDFWCSTSSPTNHGDLFLSTRFGLACNLSSQIIEPIQNRCAIVRFTGLSEQDILARLLKVAAAEKVPYVPEGLKRWFSSPPTVCDQPHPLLVSTMIQNTLAGKIDEAYLGMKQLGVRKIYRNCGLADASLSKMALTKSSNSRTGDGYLAAGNCDDVGDVLETNGRPSAARAFAGCALMVTFTLVTHGERRPSLSLAAQTVCKELEDV
ncbi:hypothetical protein JRQ81_000042 [Phrynocephalus forsythii]|uniref:Uncharacterized protein n=1 Tax=Phrynocephalus forsythii TaxID=171643 RepID=A0A9Q0X570_9SAUR|nr:hypothetical protein JRQ81_000042 [Phrynocephalus forsythii]